MFSAPTITLPLCFVSEVIQMEKGEYISSLDDKKPVITDACCYNCNCVFINLPNRLFVCGRFQFCYDTGNSWVHVSNLTKMF